MSTELTKTQPSILAMPPDQVEIYATDIANRLSKIIKTQKLYSTIQGRDYIRVEGWQTLGVFLGVTSRERSVTRREDGSYEAFVDLIKFSDGTVVGGASALCSTAEKRWGAADEYARRSMAITRATGKAYRCTFAWIVTLAGYETTPAEEMPTHETESEKYTATAAQQTKIMKILETQKVPEQYWQAIDEKMMGRKGAELPKVIKEVMKGEIHAG